ncbi:hypothetical protein GGX14DRAFT_402666 [Mycena pura]|uniref:Uncharacterized protein n=1 Tax=Mycena pura TaxID=153505 RepID=A0AAD6V1M6_9AGAR|nr:hypothetical protein GGX14DRAFT_402666 [Mycena pura]
MVTIGTYFFAEVDGRPDGKIDEFLLGGKGRSFARQSLMLMPARLVIFANPMSFASVLSKGVHAAATPSPVTCRQPPPVAPLPPPPPPAQRFPPPPAHRFPHVPSTAFTHARSSACARLLHRTPPDAATHRLRAWAIHHPRVRLLRRTRHPPPAPPTAHCQPALSTAAPRLILAHTPLAVNRPSRRLPTARRALPGCHPSHHDGDA